MVGTYQVLEIRKILPFGAILGDEEILLPTKYLPKSAGLGESIRVFIYTDSEDRLIATTLEPYGALGEIVCLEVVDIVKNGVYLDLGLAKDIFCPTKKSLQKGQKLAVQITLDKQGRLIASENLKFKKFGSSKFSKYEAVAYHKSPLGFMCIVQKNYSGMIYHNEIFSPVVLGQGFSVVIKKVRQDGKLDLKIFQDDPQKKILELLEQNGGRIEVNTDSSAEKIYQVCQMSKKTFKRALNALAQKIGQDELGSYLFSTKNK